MYFKVCPYCGAYLDLGERCDCETKEKAASGGNDTESGTGKISINSISNQICFVKEKELNHG